MFKVNIGRIRAIWNLDQKAMAKLLGVNQNSISNYENGKAEPSLSTALQISKLTGFSLVELVEQEIPFERIPAQPLDEQYIAREPETKPAQYTKSEPLGDLSNFTVLVQTVRDLQLKMDSLLPLVGGLDADGMDKLKVLEALLTIVAYLENGMDEADYKVEKKLFLDKLKAALSGKG